MLWSRFPIVAAVTALVIAVLGSTQLAAAADRTSGAKCTPQHGQAYIDAGQYGQAIREFTCLIEAQPTAVEGYRGRIEAQLLLGRYSDALGDYARVTASVEPVHPDAHATIRAGYADRLAVSPSDIPALTGASFERWSSFDYAQAIQLLNKLVDVRPNDLFGNLFRGSSRLLEGGPNNDRGAADLDRAIELAPTSADVRFVVADAYTYGQPDFERAFQEASLALDWGVGTPRVHAILATAYQAFGDLAAAASHIKTHIDLVTTELLTASPLAVGGSLALSLVPGRTYEIPVPAIAGQTISIATSSRDFWDSIAVLLAPDGTPVVGSDDANAYFAAFDWAAEQTGTYWLQVTSFESINTGKLLVKRS
jgi:tetratricopeptide (TPR) repeat protein